jgi:two-component system, OmpR family, alkaline phosphatase synthesis response regulator PhoP
MKRRILVVDDDEDILDLLKYNLEKEGYEVTTLNNSWKVVSAAKKFCPDLIVLDLLLPGLNGMELCRKLRSKERFRNTYIFFLTASSLSCQHTAYCEGGDDYIEKMMGIKSLLKKIGAVLKSDYVIRKRILNVRAGKLELDRNNGTVAFNGNIFHLSKPEFELLFFFAQNPGRDIAADHLIHSIWGSEPYIVEANVDGYVQNLKKKFGTQIITQRKPHKYNLTMATL